MARTPDRRPGESDEEGIVFESNAGGAPSTAGGMRYVSPNFQLRDAHGVFNPRRDLDTLLEVNPTSVDFGVTPPGQISYTITRVAGRVTQESWSQVANSRELKRVNYTYTGNLVSTIVTRVYSLADGTTVEAQTTTTMAYSGNLVTSSTTVRNT